MCLLCILLLTACAPPTPPLDGSGTTVSADNETTLPGDTDTTVPGDTDTTVPGDTNTTAPDDTDTTVPDDTDTTQPPDISVDSPTNLPQKVQSVEVLNKEGEVVTVTLGMAKIECGIMFPLPIGRWFLSYVFVVNPENQIVAIKISETDQTVNEIWVFPEKSTTPTDDDFHTLEPGMTLEEVIFVVGIPDYFNPNVFATLYEVDSGSIYQLTYEHSEDVDVLVNCHEFPPRD